MLKTYKVETYVTYLFCNKCENKMERIIEDPSDLVRHNMQSYKCINCGEIFSYSKDKKSFPYVDYEKIEI